MRFEPRLIREDGQVDTADQLDADLPDDLAMLAGQLADDAAFLAELYPASQSTPRKIVRAARWRAMGRRLVSPTSGLAAALVLVASITAGVTFALRQGASEVAPSPSADLAAREASSSQEGRGTLPEAASPDPSAIVSHTWQFNQLGVDRAPSGGRSSGALSAEQVRGMTGAEMEGWIDLMESKNLSQQPLSF